jgi:hypothetical protein
MDIRRCGCGGRSQREIFNRTRVRAGLVRKLEPGEREVHSWRIAAKVRVPVRAKPQLQGLNSCKGQGLVITSAAQECK